MRSLLALLAVCSFAFLSNSSRANDTKGPLLFMDTSATLLVGTGFDLPGENVTTLTLEHASGWVWGDMFAFLDVQKLHSHPFEDDSWYGEISPRLSFGKLTGLKMAEGSLMKDLLIASTWERGKNGVEALLLGLGSDLRVDGFKFVKFNAYMRKDIDAGLGFDDVQLTLSWNRDFAFDGEVIRFDGFIDYVLGLNVQAPSLHIVPQIKWDMGRKWGSPGKVYLGTEIDIWRNQFGVRNRSGLDTHQFAWNLILKAHF